MRTDGFVIIGVHTPEFTHERDVDNVEKALERLQIEFAVAIDNDWATWRSYHNRYWPAMYFIDKGRARIRYLKDRRRPVRLLRVGDSGAPRRTVHGQLTNFNSHCDRRNA